MADLKEKLSVKDLTEVSSESNDPAYLAWRDQKVRAALNSAKAHPERRVAQAEVWKKYGLE